MDATTEEHRGFVSRSASAHTWAAGRRVRILVSTAAALASAGQVLAAVLVVTNTTDVANGDVSSPAALLASPGSDGISLREAIEAANNVPGPHTITFAPALGGETIVLTNSLPVITRDGVSLSGPRDAEGRPTLTLSGPTVSPNAFLVFASDFSLTGLRMINIRVRQGAAVFIRAGRPELPGSARVANIRIESNQFNNQDVVDGGNAITIATENGSSDAAVREVVIAQNTFLHFEGDIDAIGAGISGTNGRFESLVISGNTFSENSFPFEIALTGSDGRFSGVRIVGNTFRNNHQTITLTGAQSLAGFPPAFGNVLDDVLISGNVISGSSNPSIQMAGGVSATGSAILNTQIVNNIITGGSTCGLCVVGGGGDGATGNRVEGIHVVNNTHIGLAFSGGVSIFPNQSGASGNSVTGVRVLNTIFVAGGVNFGGDAHAGEIGYCITSDSALVGLNGNISADPKFVNSAGGDYRLQAGSPAIDAGTSDGASPADVEGCARFDDPATPNHGAGDRPYFDIGAFEFGPCVTRSLVLVGRARPPARVVGASR